LLFQIDPSPRLIPGGGFFFGPDLLNDPFFFRNPREVRFRCVNLFGDNRIGVPQDGLHVFEPGAGVDQGLCMPMSERMRGNELRGLSAVGLKANTANDLPGGFRGYFGPITSDG